MKRIKSASVSILLLCFALEMVTFGGESPSENKAHPEEYAVYSAVISARYSKWKHLVISRDIIGYDLTPYGKENYLSFIKGSPNISEMVVDDYSVRNKTSVRLERLFDLNTKYYLIGKGDAVPPEVVGLSDGIEFVSTVYLSRVGFNADKTQALITTSYVCGLLCGAGFVIVLKKDKDHWQILSEKKEWVS